MRVTPRIPPRALRRCLSRFARELYAAGAVTPTALQLDNTAAKIEFYSRKSALRWDGFRSYGVFWEQGATLAPKPLYRTIHPFTADGSSGRLRTRRCAPRSGCQRLARADRSRSNRNDRATGLD